MKEILLTQGKVALVDDEDFERINQHKWYAYNNHGYQWYARREIKKPNGKRTTQCMHRVIMKVKKGQELDHRNHDGLDNRKCNLRICTRAQNSMNRKKQRETSSRYKGVDWLKQRNKWRARIKVNQKSIHLGCFLLEPDAAKAYDAKAKELFGEFAYFNFQ